MIKQWRSDQLLENHVCTMHVQKQGGTHSNRIHHSVSTEAFMKMNENRHVRASVCLYMCAAGGIHFRTTRPMFVCACRSFNKFLNNKSPKLNGSLSSTQIA